MVMLSHNDLKKGAKIDLDGHPWLIIDADFVKPGKGQAFTRTRIRSYITGNTVERTFKSNEKTLKADIEDRNCQYLYADGEFHHFMDSTSFDQIQISSENLGDAAKWLEENMEVQVLLHNGKAISVEPPNFVDMEIVYCEPGVKGDTAQGTTKPATLSTGAIVNVPLFINQGERIKIDTRTGDYLERSK